MATDSNGVLRVLRDFYGKISNVVNATVEEHQKIDKVGKALATRIYEICNDEYKKNNSKKK